MGCLLSSASLPPILTANDWSIVVISCMRFVSTKVVSHMLISCLSFPHNVEKLRNYLIVNEMIFFNNQT